MKKKVRETQCLSRNPITGEKFNFGTSTAADRLLSKLETDESASYIVLFAEFDTDRLRIRARRKHQTVRSGVSSESDETEEDLLTDATDSAMRQAEKVKTALGITGSGLILLAVAWTYDHALRLAEMFPEVHSCDVVFGTNREQRPLACLTLHDEENRTFGWMWSFYPSRSKWVWQWWTGRAIPALAGPRFCLGLRVMLTDQEFNEVQSFKNQMKPGGSFPNAVGRLCAWHKNDRGCANHARFKGHICKAQDNVNNYAEWASIYGWLWSFTVHLETESEFLVSKMLLEMYLEESEDTHVGKLGDNFRTELRDWISESFMSEKEMLSSHHFQDTMSLHRGGLLLLLLFGSRLGSRLGRPAPFLCSHCGNLLFT